MDKGNANYSLYWNADFQYKIAHGQSLCKQTAIREDYSRISSEEAAFDLSLTTFGLQAYCRESLVLPVFVEPMSDIDLALVASVPWRNCVDSLEASLTLG